MATLVGAASQFATPGQGERGAWDPNAHPPLTPPRAVPRAARRAQFARAELLATLAGKPLYLANGWHEVERTTVPAFEYRTEGSSRTSGSMIW